MEKKFVAKPVYVKLFCDKCGKEMELSNTIGGAYFAIEYVYSCPNCNEKIRSLKKYPYLEYIETAVPIVTSSK